MDREFKVRLGAQLAAKFKGQPKHLVQLRELFRSQDDKLSYYDLFSYIEYVLRIKLQNWEEDALEGRLDRLGMAFIEFNEFNEFHGFNGLHGLRQFSGFNGFSGSSLLRFGARSTALPTLPTLAVEAVEHAPEDGPTGGPLSLRRASRVPRCRVCA